MSTLARDIMQTHVVTVAPSDTQAAAMRVLSDEGIHGAPVIDEAGRVVGVVSVTDLLRAAVEAEDNARPGYGYFEEGVEQFPAGLAELLREGLEEGDRGPRVEEVMTGSIARVDPGATVQEVARTLRENRVHRVLVLEHDALVGVISTFDLIALLEKQG